MQYAFAYSSLTSISLPPSVDTLQTYCFRGCKNLETFIIPSESELRDISYGVFYECVNLEVIKCNASNFIVENNALYDKDRTQFFVLPPKSSVKFFSFPETLRTIKPYALFGCYHLEIVLIPSNSVVEINQYVFKNCYNLRQINIPASVQVVGQGAFEGCYRLQCGLNIENKSSIFRKTLLQTSKLPEKCMLSCIEKCTKTLIHFHLSIKYLAIIMCV